MRYHFCVITSTWIVHVCMINYIQLSRLQFFAIISSGTFGSGLAASIVKLQQMWSYCQTLWLWPLVNCCSAALPGIFVGCVSQAWPANVPRFLGFEFLWESILQTALLLSAGVVALFQQLMDEVDVQSTEVCKELSGDISWGCTEPDPNLISSVKKSNCFITEVYEMRWFSLHAYVPLPHVHFPMRASDPLHLQLSPHVCEFYAENSW